MRHGCPLPRRLGNYIHEARADASGRLFPSVSDGTDEQFRSDASSVIYAILGQGGTSGSVSACDLAAATETFRGVTGESLRNMRGTVKSFLSQNGRSKAKAVMIDGKFASAAGLAVALGAQRLHLRIPSDLVVPAVGSLMNQLFLRHRDGLDLFQDIETHMSLASACAEVNGQQPVNDEVAQVQWKHAIHNAAIDAGLSPEMQQVPS